MSEPIAWTDGTRRLGDLKPWPRNPREILREKADRLIHSLSRFGQPDVIAIGPDNEVYNGHQRLAVWMREHGPDYEVAVRMSSRPLTEDERGELSVLLHEAAIGRWNMDTLANEFKLADLLEWGFKEHQLKWANDGALDLDGEPEEEPEKTAMICPKCGFTFYV